MESTIKRTNAFILYCKDVKASVTAKNGTKSKKEIQTIIRSQWKTLSTEEKLSYKESAEQHNKIVPKKQSSVSKDDSNVTKTESKRTQYFNFCKQHKPELKAKYPTYTGRQIMSLLSDMWTLEKIKMLTDQKEKPSKKNIKKKLDIHDYKKYIADNKPTVKSQYPNYTGRQILSIVQRMWKEYKTNYTSSQVTENTEETVSETESKSDSEGESIESIETENIQIRNANINQFQVKLEEVDNFINEFLESNNIVCDIKKTLFNENFNKSRLKREFKLRINNDLYLSFRININESHVVMFIKNYNYEAPYMEYEDEQFVKKLFVKMISKLNNILFEYETNNNNTSNSKQFSFGIQYLPNYSTYKDLSRIFKAIDIEWKTNKSICNTLEKYGKLSSCFDNKNKLMGLQFGNWNYFQSYDSYDELCHYDGKRTVKKAQEYERQIELEYERQRELERELERQESEENETNNNDNDDDN